MPRYIDINKIDNFDVQSELLFYHYSVEDVKQILGCFPREDAAPVIHAHWIADPEDPFDGMCVCSNPGCNCKVWDMDADHIFYCPNCGAKMDEEEEDA